MRLRPLPLALLSCLATGAFAADLMVPMDLVDGSGPTRRIGTVAVSETPHGVLFTPQLQGLPPGVHGFHVHENGSCQPQTKDGNPVPAGAAGGHYDPQASKRHGTPWGDGHLGDLPGLVVAADGSAGYAVLAPRLKMSDLPKRALMVHVGGDNHADHPAPLGGGGARMACGVIPG